MKYNIVAFKELMEKYEELLKEDFYDTFEELGVDEPADTLAIKCDSFFSPRYCFLCRSAGYYKAGNPDTHTMKWQEFYRPACYRCMWGYGETETEAGAFPCVNANYHLIRDSEEVGEMLEYLKKRVAEMKHIIKKYENDNETI